MAEPLAPMNMGNVGTPGGGKRKKRKNRSSGKKQGNPADEETVSGADLRTKPEIQAAAGADVKAVAEISVGTDKKQACGGADKLLSASKFELFLESLNKAQRDYQSVKQNDKEVSAPTSQDIASKSPGGKEGVTSSVTGANNKKCTGTDSQAANETGPHTVSGTHDQSQYPQATGSNYSHNAAADIALVCHTVNVTSSKTGTAAANKTNKDTASQKGVKGAHSADLVNQSLSADAGVKADFGAGIKVEANAGIKVEPAAHQANSPLHSDSKAAQKNKGKSLQVVPEQGGAVPPVPQGGVSLTAAPDPSAPAEVQKSKSELSRERRALQEAQRARKAAALQEGGGGAKPPQTNKPPKETKQARDSAVGGGATDSRGSVGDKGAARKQDLPGGGSGGLSGGVPGGGAKDATQKVRVSDSVQADNVRMVLRERRKLERHGVPHRTEGLQRKVGLFSHLHQYERALPLTRDLKFTGAGTIHPAVVRLGLQYAEGVVCGSNARCFALLLTLRTVISDYHTPLNTDLSRDLEPRILRPAISFLTQCRPLSVSMGNAIRHLKRAITLTPPGCPDHEAKARLCEEIDKFLNERIILAAQAISTFAGSKIHDGDVILVYACSSLIHTVLFNAHDAGKQFSVVVVDSRPKLEGREMLRRLVQHGISCSYILINSISYVIKEVTKVFLGAHALLANGYMMSRVGSSQVALIASAHNVPVIVCCETYKFSEKVQTDSFVFNELGDPNDLVSTGGVGGGALARWQEEDHLSMLNLVYDVTPPALINMVITDITDFGLVPCTSVPVVLRVKSAEP